MGLVWERKLLPGFDWEAICCCFLLIFIGGIHHQYFLLSSSSSSSTAPRPPPSTFLFLHLQVLQKQTLFRHVSVDPQIISNDLAPPEPRAKYSFNSRTSS